MRRVAVLMLLACGCAESPSAGSADTGARAAVETFFTGLIAGDPRKAHESLDAESRQRVSPGEFARLAAAYSRNLGFKAESVHIRACEEQGDAATAHVVVNGQGAGHSQRYADGVTLRRVDGRWGVVLPTNFGRAKK